MPKFVLREGIHSEGGKTYYPGDVIDSKSDLSRFNRQFKCMRFEPVVENAAKPVAEVPDEPVAGGVGPALNTPSSLEDITVAQLKDLAEGHEIDLGTATRKAEIIEVLRENGIEIG